MASVKNSIMFTTGGGTNITVVANYSALPDPTTVSGQFYWCESSQGTAWLPGGLGGTYYNSGMYYSNGVSWNFMNVPYQATQSEVNAGTNTDKFVTPSTLSNSNWAFTTAKVLATALSGLTASSGTFTSSDTILGAFGKLKFLIDTTIPTLATKSMSAYSMRANNTASTADATEFTFRQSGLSSYSGTITWTGTTAPSGVESHTFNWQQIGNVVQLNLNLHYATVGNGLTAVVISLPSDLPNPVKPTGFTGASERLYIGSGRLSTSDTGNLSTAGECFLRANAADNGFEILISQASSNAKNAQITIEYFTS
jgi:hypothetical protein